MNIHNGITCTVSNNYSQQISHVLRVDEGWRRRLYRLFFWQHHWNAPSCSPLPFLSRCLSAFQACFSRQSLIIYHFHINALPFSALSRLANFSVQGHVIDDVTTMAHVSWRSWSLNRQLGSFIVHNWEKHGEILPDMVEIAMSIKESTHVLWGRLLKGQHVSAPCN